MSIINNKEVVARFNREVIAGKDLKSFRSIDGAGFREPFCASRYLTSFRME